MAAETQVDANSCAATRKTVLVMSEENRKVDGIYAGYFTGAAGTSLCLIVFLQGKISGADEGGGIYNGCYEEGEIDKIEGTVNFQLSPDQTSITGSNSGEEPMIFDVPFQFPFDFAEKEEIFRIQTPYGPINAIFRRLRKL